MITPFNTKAFYLLYPQTANTIQDTAYDADGNEIDYDLEAVNAKAAEMQAEEEAKNQAVHDKLAAIGLTPDDLQRILGK